MLLRLYSEGINRREPLKSEFEIVVVGTSIGGLGALQTLLSGLPCGFPVPVVIVQHRGKDSETGLCDFLARNSRLPISEPDDKEAIVPGRAYLAPRDYHLLIEKGNFALSTDAPVGFARPSIDVLFESVANEYKERAIGIVLTGANRDGARGLSVIKTKGGLTLVEDPASAACREMPDAAIAMTAVDHVLSLEEIGPFLGARCPSVTPDSLATSDPQRSGGEGDSNSGPLSTGIHYGS
jgi:two-component system chemotaxis response regulator CheB